MKCPVCDQENTTMLCPQCGFDASRDYEQYPTFGPVSRMPSVSAKKKQTSQGHKLELQSARDQIETLKREQRILTGSLIPENKQLKERILSLVNENKELTKSLHKTRTEADALKCQYDSVIPENQQLKEQILLLADEIKARDMALREATHEANALKQEHDSLRQNLGNLRNRNNYLGQIKNELKHENVELKSALEAEHRKNAELEAALKTERSKIAELEAALEAERNKGVLSRIFNR